MRGWCLWAHRGLFEPDAGPLKQTRDPEANVDGQKSAHQAPLLPQTPAAVGLPGRSERSSRLHGVAGRAGAGAPICGAAQRGWTARAGLDSEASA